jgi:hypothetical protein
VVQVGVLSADNRSLSQSLPNDVALPAPGPSIRKIVGLNTRLADRTGAFLRLPALTIAGARDFVNQLVKLQSDKDNIVALRAWRNSERDQGT